MAARANSAALNAALNAYVREYQYKNLNSAVLNYAYGNYNWKSNRNSRRTAIGYFSLPENKRTRANININRNMRLNRMRAGIKTARKTPKELKNAQRKTNAGRVIRKAYLKSRTAGAKKAGKRVAVNRYKKYEADQAEKARFAAAAARAATRKAEANAKRATIGSVKVSSIKGSSSGGYGLSAAGRAAPGGGQRGTATPVNRAQAPTVVLPKTTGLSENALARLTTVVEREVQPKKKSSVQSSISKKLGLKR